jgi:PAS domain S-box-containing protein
MATIANAELHLPRLSPQDGLRLILETALDAVVVMKSNGVVADWNGHAVGMFGWSPGEAVGRTMADLIIPVRYREAHRNGIRRYLETGQGEILGRHIELSGLKRNGEEFPIELSVSPIQDGESILFVGFLRDLTERNALRVAQSELAHVARLTTMGGVAASIAHEINQPMVAIVAYGNASLRWLAHTPPNLDEVRHCLNSIVKTGLHAGDVIESIRAIFKKSDEKKAPLDVNAIIREVLRLMHGEIEIGRVSVQTELNSELPKVLGHPIQLQLVFRNLIVNAVEAMSSVTDRRRVLNIRSETKPPSGVRIAVADSGPGIDPESMDRIFHAFFTTKSQGTGMGLSICKSIVEAHGGQLSASRSHPHGSIFEIVLPDSQAA